MSGEKDISSSSGDGLSGADVDKTLAANAESEDLGQEPCVGPAESVPNPEHRERRWTLYCCYDDNAAGGWWFDGDGPRIPSNETVPVVEASLLEASERRAEEAERFGTNMVRLNQLERHEASLAQESAESAQQELDRLRGEVRRAFALLNDSAWDDKIARTQARLILRPALAQQKEGPS